MTKKLFKETLSSLNIINMTNHEILWQLMIQTLHENQKNPNFVSKYEAYKTCNSTESITNYGIKDGFIRTKKKDDTILVALEDLQFYNNISLSFQRAKKDGIIKDAKILGFRKYEVVNVKTQGQAIAKHQFKILNNFVNDFLETYYKISLDSITKKKTPNLTTPQP
jgi:hypothetical protein